MADRTADQTLVLNHPLPGRCRVRNSPANRVPSHGTAAFGSAYAIDLVPVDDAGRSAPRAWRGLVTPEPPEIFVGFGQPVLAPLSGVVVGVHDGEPDHEARRSPLTVVPYLLGQGDRARRGAAGLAGNHVVLAAAEDGPYVLLAHLQRSSVSVAPGDVVPAGTPVGRCGNSGNSTEPHLHLQASDVTDWDRARGVPIGFSDGRGGVRLPRNGEITGA